MSYLSTGESLNNKTPFVDSYNTKENTLTYPNSHKLKRTLFVKEINDWLDQYILPEHFDFNNTLHFEKSLEDDDILLMKNKHTVHRLLKTLCKLIQKKYKINNEYQLKEDLCYFFYCMSS